MAKQPVALCFYSSASHWGIAKASQMATNLARVTGLPFVQPVAEA